MEEREQSGRLTLIDRQELTVTAVTEVVSFDEGGVVLHTRLGTLEILGRELSLKQLSIDGGQVEVRGNISALNYQEPRAAGWKKRLFG